MENAKEMSVCADKLRRVLETLSSSISLSVKSIIENLTDAVQAVETIEKTQKIGTEIADLLSIYLLVNQGESIDCKHRPLLQKYDLL